jgi:FkbM family methyltransferase
MNPRVTKLLRSIGLVVYRWPPPETMEHILRAQLRRLAVDCVLDVGANEGQYAALLRQIGYEGWIVSFEPNPECLAALQSAMASDPRWRCFPVALSDKAERVAFHVASSSDFSSFLEPSDYGKKAWPEMDGHSIEVSSTRLDDCFEDLRRELGFSRAFLKMDTQGHDLAVLDGARGCREFLVGLQIELSLKPVYRGQPDIGEALSAVRAAGFDPVAFVPVNKDRSGALVEVDCIAQRRADG